MSGTFVRGQRDAYVPLRPSRSGTDIRPYRDVPLSRYPSRRLAASPEAGHPLAVGSVGVAATDVGQARNLRPVRATARHSLTLAVQAA